MNYSKSVNLLKLKNALITECKGKTMTKKGLFIPIEDNDLFVSLDESLKPKGIYLDLIAWELKEKSQFGDTHIIKQSLSREAREAMSEEEIKNMPILGGMRPLERVENPLQASAEVTITEDNVPF